MDRGIARRQFLRFLAGSPLLASAGVASCTAVGLPGGRSGKGRPRNIFELEALAKRALGKKAYAYAAGGSDDELTLRANHEAYRQLQIRCRRLVDVSGVDTRSVVLQEPVPFPIALAPVGFQSLFHRDAELATARGAAAMDALMIASSVSSESIADIANERARPVWFQLYPTANRDITRGLLERADAAGCGVVVLTVDTPVIGNREKHGDYLASMLAGGERAANYEGLRTDEPILDPTMTWDMLDWLRNNCRMRIAVKGIVTGGDALRCAERGADAIIVSNHGGRQEESGRATIDCLSEVVQAAGDDMTILIDGGIRRGTDVFKALALGADAVCIGRPYVWGLAAMGPDGVALALEILHSELVRAMQLAGVTSIPALDASFVQRKV